MSASVEKERSVQVVDGSSRVKKINSLFNSAKTRQDGWRMLSSFLPHCPDEYFLQFCVSWMQNCCKIDGSVKNKEYAITLLGNLFKISEKYQELKKSVSFFITTQYFDFFFKYFLNSQAGWDCTKNCLMFYRGACGGFQDVLQKHLTQEINKNFQISVNVAECFALLPCTGGGGNNGINYKRNWKSQFMKILDICHSILNELYGDAEETGLHEYDTTQDTYHKSVQQEKSRAMDHLATQLYNHTTILNCMLLNQYPAPKTIPPDVIFQLICRGLALNPKSLEQRQTTKLIALQKVLPQVHGVFLSLLKATVVSCKNLLYPYSYLVCKLIKQVLEWTDGHSVYIGEKSIAELRISAYETLCNWLAVARNGSCVEGISDSVISSAISDILTKKAVVFLKAKCQNKDKELTTRRVDVIPDSRLCYPALKSLQFLLKFSGVSLKPEEHKFLQEMVVELLLDTQKTAAGSVAPPFDSPKCRKELYSLLLELVHQPCSKWAPPTQFALSLFGRGVSDGSPDVSSFCSAALNFTTIIIHPQYDNGGFSTCETVNARNIMEPEITWTEGPSDLEGGKVEGDSLVENVVEVNEDVASVMTDPEEKLSDANEELIISSSEDSRTTIPYLKEAEGEEEEKNVSLEVKDFIEIEEVVMQMEEEVEETEKTEEVEETEKTEEVEETEKTEEVEQAEKTEKMVKTEEAEEAEEAESTQNHEEPVAKRRKVSEPPETPIKEKQSETPTSVSESKRKGDRSEESETSQETWTAAENHPKKRYFLRSKTKGSTDDSEDAVRLGSSPDSGKSTPVRGLGQNTPAVQTPSRRKTKGPPKTKTSSEADPKTTDEDVDEENIKAAFDDSLID